MNTNAELAVGLLRAEGGNLRHALTLAERRQDWGSANNILHGLNHLMLLDGRWAEWDRILLQFEGLTTDPTDAAGGPRVGREDLWRTVLRFRASYADERHDLASTEKLLRRLLEEDHRRGDEGNTAVALHRLGVVAQERGEWGEAERWYRESLAIAERLGHEQDRAKSLGQLGQLAEKRGQVSEAIAFFRQAEQIFERIGDAPNLEIVRNSLKRVQSS